VWDMEEGSTLWPECVVVYDILDKRKEARVCADSGDTGLRGPHQTRLV
jgi:hypothetical protein